MFQPQLFDGARNGFEIFCDLDTFDSEELAGSRDTFLHFTGTMAVDLEATGPDHDAFSLAASQVLRLHVYTPDADMQLQFVPHWLATSHERCTLGLVLRGK